MAAAIRREHPAHPGAEREANHGQRAPGIGAKTISKYLFEARCRSEFVAEKAWPERGFTRRTRGRREHVTRTRVPPAAAPGERIALMVVGLGRERQAAKVLQRPNLCRIDAVLREEHRIRRHAGSRALEELEQVLRGLRGCVLLEQLRQIAMNEVVVSREGLRRAISIHRQTLATTLGR